MKDEILTNNYHHLKLYKNHYKVVFIYYNEKIGLWDPCFKQTRHRINRLIRQGVPVIEIH